MTRRSLANSTRSKRRKPARQPTKESTTEEDVLFEIRDIIDEKWVRGKLLYKVDWADNPTTGERYDPTWEPAENVTEAAVVDWEREARRRRGVESQSSPVESSSQPVLGPNWRAKRHRHRSVSEDYERPRKRSRGSVDSGYTSTGQDGDGDVTPVDFIPESRGRIVLEIAPPPGFDPSEYRIISSSQSAPSSQDIPPEATASQGLDSQRSLGTIPESQGFDYSLYTQSTGQSTDQSAAIPIASATLEEACQPALGGSPLPSDTEGQPSRSDLEIPSRQPGNSQVVSKHSSALLGTPHFPEDDVHDPLGRASPAPEHLSRQSDSSRSGVFLTQPDYGFSGFLEEL